MRSPLTEARELVHGPRQADYGHPRENFARIRAGWEVITGVALTNRQLAHMMAWLKISRDVNRPIADNPRDICGYYEAAFLADQPVVPDPDDTATTAQGEQA